MPYGFLNIQEEYDMAISPSPRSRRDQLKAEEMKRDRFLGRLVIWCLCGAVAMLSVFVRQHLSERQAATNPRPFGEYGVQQDPRPLTDYSSQQDPFFRIQTEHDTRDGGNFTIVKSRQP
jgi:hypothetical protein